MTATAAHIKTHARITQPLIFVRMSQVLPEEYAECKAQLGGQAASSYYLIVKPTARAEVGRA